MRLLREVEQRSREWRKQDIAWREEVEESIQERHTQNAEELRRSRSMSALINLFIAILGGVAALVGFHATGM